MPRSAVHLLIRKNLDIPATDQVFRRETGYYALVTPTAILRTMRNWLRAGYPDGAPQQDYVALLAVLRHNLTDAEISRVAARLTGGRAPTDPVDDSEIGASISALVLGEPSDADVERVRAYLVAGGWSLSDPHLSK